MAVVNLALDIIGLSFCLCQYVNQSISMVHIISIQNIMRQIETNLVLIYFLCFLLLLGVQGQSLHNDDLSGPLLHPTTPTDSTHPAANKTESRTQNPRKENQNSPSISYLISLLTMEQLSPCSLLLFQDRGHNDDAVSSILTWNEVEGHRSYFSVKYAFPTEEQIAGLLTTVQEFHLPAKNISVALSSSSTLPLHFPITVGNYHRRSDQCLVVILFLADARPQFVTQIYNLLTPVFIPITRKDEDYYIFMSPPDILDEILLMPQLPGRIKYKLGIGMEIKDNGTQPMEDVRHEVVVKTVCYFCKEGGFPEVLSFPSKFTPSFEYFPDFIQNLNGKLLKIAIPYIRARVEADAPWTGVGNAKRGIWKILFEQYLNLKFNFTYNIFVSTGANGNIGGGGTGLQLPNGTWIGVTGDLVSGKADIGIVTANTPKRIHYIDFTEAFFDIGYLTFVTSEGARVFSPAALLWPFDLAMWGCIGLSTLVAFAVFTCIIKAIFWLDLGSGDSLNFARRGMISQQIWNFSYQLQFVMTSFLDQDCVMPTFAPLRTFVAIWLFFTLVLTTLYRSKLVSLLAFPLIETIPTTFDELAYSKFTVGFMKHGDSAYNTLAASTDPVYVKLVNEMEVVNGVGLECLEKVVTSKYGCIAYDFALRHLKERNLSEADTMKLVFAPAHTYNIFLGLATEGKSIYRNNFGKWLSYTRAFHLADVWEDWDMYHTVRVLKREWWFATNQSEKADKNLGGGASDDNLTLKHISGSFYILSALLAICSVFFIAEHFHKHRKAIGKMVSKAWSLLTICVDKMFVLSSTEMDPYT